MSATKTAPSPSTYVSGHCAVGAHDRCRGAYVGTDCTCSCHSEPEPAPESEPIADPQSGATPEQVSSSPVELSVGDLTAGHLGTVATLTDFHRQGVVHRITGRLVDVWHLTAGRMSNVVLRDWTAEPPLGPWVSPHGGWMCRRDQEVELEWWADAAVAGPHTQHTVTVTDPATAQPT